MIKWPNTLAFDYRRRDKLEIIWITGRSIGKDLAGTTEIGLINEMSNLGHTVTLFSPGEKDGLINCEQLKYNIIRIKGVETLTGTWGLRYQLRKHRDKIDRADIILVDWRYVNSLKNKLWKYNKKWLIIDRGPPAYSGLMAKIQTRFWLKSWNTASKYSNGGFVVSTAHKEFVENIIDRSMYIKVIKAGTNLNDFKNINKEIKDTIKFIYVGRLDKNRGMENIIKMFNNMGRIKLESELSIIGEGDYSNIFKKISKNSSKMVYYGKLSRSETLKIMKKSHVGILPMPDTPIWRIASPLKLAEYAASGLLTIGPKHPGNKIEKDTTWSLLSNKKEWYDDYIEIINNIIVDESFESRSREALEDSRELDWKVITKQLLKELESII